MPADPKKVPGVLSGAAFLMAVSAVGPGFLTQTTTFTAKLGAALAFAILLSTLIDIGAQLNTWRVICISGKRGNEVVNAVIPGFGWVVVGVIVAGSFVFNLGNFAGCAQGLAVLTGLEHHWGILLSAAVAVVLFLQPRMLLGVDWFSKSLGAAMLLMMLYVVVITAPPVADAARQAFWPDDIDVGMIVTLVGGTVGGYIMFSGAHRLLDGEVTGPENARTITRASVQGILITAVMRTLLFLAVLGVVAGGHTLSADRPVFDAFRLGAGEVGYVLSGLIFWAAAITSVVGCSYTAISFLGFKKGDSLYARLIVAFVLLSMALTLALRFLDVTPARLLIAAGTINGLLLPIVLGAILLAAYRGRLLGDYRHPWWAGALGLLAWLVSVWFAYSTVASVIR